MERVAGADAADGRRVVTAVEMFRVGRLSAEAAVARLALAGDIDAIASEPRLSAIARRHGLDDVLAVREAVVHGASATPRDVGRMFDAAVLACPEAAVAAVSLGDPALLARATGEIVMWLCAHGLVVPGARVLDLGCGIGRVAAALAPVVGEVLGVDVSAEMVAEARRRVRAGNVRFEASDGMDLPPLAGPVDLVLAVDSFPYLVQAGVAERHVAEASQALRPGGALVVLNWSYCGLAAVRCEVACWAARYGFTLRQDGAPAFALWDGAAFVLKKDGNAAGPARVEMGDATSLTA